jgi:hypothetical protein
MIDTKRKAEASMIDTKRKAEAFVSRRGFFHGPSHEDACLLSCQDAAAIAEPALVNKGKRGNHQVWAQDIVPHAQRGHSDDIADNSTGYVDLEKFEPTGEEVALQRVSHASLWSTNDSNLACDGDTGSSRGVVPSSNVASSVCDPCVDAGELDKAAARDDEHIMAAAREWFAELEAEERTMASPTSTSNGHAVDDAVMISFPPTVEKAVLRIQSLRRAMVAKEEIKKLSGEAVFANAQAVPTSPSKTCPEAVSSSRPRSIGGA